MPAYFTIVYVIYSTMSTIIGPLYPMAVTLIYYDQRIRHEGYDIEWMINAAGLNAPATPPAAKSPTGTPQPEEQQA